MYAYRQEGCIESIAPAHPTYPRHHLNSHHVNHTHRYDPRRRSMHAGAIAKSLFVVASLPLDLRRARPYLPWVRKGRGDGGEGSLSSRRHPYRQLTAATLGRMLVLTLTLRC